MLSLDQKPAKTRDDLLSSLPDKKYFFKVFRRQRAFLFLGILMSLGLAAVALLMVKDKYTSKVHAVYDRTDTSMSSNFNSVLKYQTLGTLFEIKLQSPAFLGRVGQLAGGMKIMQDSGGKGLVSEAKAMIKKVKDKYLAKELTEEQKLEIYANFLKTNIVPINDPVSGIMNITVYGTTAENAQNIAAQAMELFIREELSADVNALDLKLDFMRQKAMGMKSQTEQVQKKSKKTPITPPVNKLTPEEQFKLNQEEAQLEEQIRLKRMELDRATTDNSTRRIALETELNRMKTMLQPNHPSVQAKEEELKKLKQSNKITNRLSAQIQAIKRQLWRIKAKKIGASANIGNILEGSYTQAQVSPEGSFLISLTEKIQDLHSERSDLFRQIENPAMRTRLKVVSPASYEPDPSKPKSVITAIGILMLGIMASIGHMFFREFYCSLARDDWRVQRVTGLPVLSQITDTSMRGFPRITPKLADSLRGQLSTRSKPTIAAKTLLSYRQIELALKRHTQGNVQLFINPGSHDQTSGFFYNLMNIFTTDFNQSCLIIDCNINDPIVQLANSGGESFWADPTNEDKAMVVYGDKDKAFDIIPPPQKLTGESSRVFNPGSLSKIIERLKVNYSRIFIRGFPESFFVENQAFSDASTDCILCVDAKNTTFFELERCIAQLDTNQIRGIILIGT